MNCEEAGVIGVSSVGVARTASGAEIIMRFLLIAACLAAAQATEYHDTIAAGDEAALKKLVASKPKLLNTVGPGGQSPLMNAVLSGNAAAVKVLLAAGADTSVAEQDGYTPMHGAGFQGRSEIAKLLIDHGLNPSDRHKDGYTPLHRACWGAEERHTETVRVLLEAGVSPQEKANNGGLPVQMAQNNPATRKLLHTYIHKDTPIPGLHAKGEL